MNNGYLFDSLSCADRARVALQAIAEQNLEEVNVQYVIREDGKETPVSDWYSFDLYLIFGFVEAERANALWRAWLA